MAISLYPANESLFVRFARCINGINESSTFQGTTSNTRAAIIASSFQLTNRDVVDGLYSQLASENTANSAWIAYMTQLMNGSLIEMYLDDSPPITSADTTTALNALIAQMDATSQSINRPTIGSTATAGSSNVGNGQVIVATKNGLGLQEDYIMAETITITCTDDAYPGGSATAGQEPFSIVGQIAVENLAWNWPQGSGANTTTNTFDPAATGGLLANASFDTWPDAAVIAPSWSLIMGTVPTTVARSADSFNGAYALSFIGNGSELTSIRQTVTLQPNTVYVFGCWMKSDGSVAAGTIRFRLVNADSNTVVNDDQGNAISFTKTAASLTSSYTLFSGTICTPNVLPTNCAWEIGLSVALTNTEVVYFDDMTLTAPTQLYAGGPSVTIVRGSTDFATNDTFSLVMTNSLGTNSFARSLDRSFGLKQLGLIIPSSGSPTIPDSLLS